MVHTLSHPDETPAPPETPVVAATPTAPADPVTPALGVSQVHRYYQLVDAGDVPALVALFAPDARYHRPGYEPMVGHAELERFYRDQRVIRTGVHTLATVVTTDDEVAVHGLFRGVLHDGGEVELRFADFFRMTPQGRIASRHTFFHVPAV